MKLENEHVVGVQTPPRKSYNPFDSDDDDTNAKGHLNGYDIKSFEATPDSLTFHLDSSNLSWEEAILGHPRILSNSIPADASNEEVLYRKDADLFTDKTITECELPDLIFSYKDNGLNSVKDIGIDEGVPAHDKVWIKSLDDHDSKNLSSVLAFDADVHGDVLFTNDVKKDTFSQDLTEDLVESGLVHEDLERPYSADKCRTDDLLKTDKFEHDSSMKENESNFDWQSTGGLVESGGIVDGKQNPLGGEKDEVDCKKVEMTEKEVSEEEHGESLEHVDPSVMHEVEATTESNVALCAGKSVVQPSLMLEAEVTVDSSDALHEGKSLEQLSLMHEAEGITKSNEAQPAEVSLAQPSNMHGTEAAKESNEALHAELSPAQPSIMHEVAIIMESNESQTEEASSVQSVELPALLEPAGRGVLSYNSKVESGSIILDFNAAASISEREVGILQKNEAVEKPPVAQTMSRDDGKPDPGCSILDFETDRRVHGETSFSAAMPPPASITYMGSNAHAGNISLRSESSAGSTRSFAFPVLQAEWNSSPVRMAKADQRRFHKQRGWVHSLVCCKF